MASVVEIIHHGHDSFTPEPTFITKHRFAGDARTEKKKLVKIKNMVLAGTLALHAGLQDRGFCRRAISAFSMYSSNLPKQMVEGELTANGKNWVNRFPCRSISTSSSEDGLPVLRLHALRRLPRRPPRPSRKNPWAIRTRYRSGVFRSSTMCSTFLTPQRAAGKTVANDLREGNAATMAVIHALETLYSRQRRQNGGGGWVDRA